MDTSQKVGDQPGRLAGDQSHESEDVRPRPLHFGGEQARHVRAELRDEEAAGLLSRKGGGAQGEGGRVEIKLQPAHVAYNLAIKRNF